MGRLAGAFGVRGWVKVVPLSADPGALLEHNPWYVEGPQGWVAHAVREARMHGATIIAQVDGIATREDAQAIRGRPVGVPRESLPLLAKDEAYWSDMVGLSVVNRRGDALGVVVDLQDNGAHGILRVRDDSAGTRLIPYVPAIVDGVDWDARRIVVDWEADW